MKLLLVTTALLFYMQSFRIVNAQETPADIFQDCINYEVSSTKQKFEDSKTACGNLGGKMASSDLTNSVLAAKATEAVKAYRDSTKNKAPIWIGIQTNEEIGEGVKFHFLDGQEVVDAEMNGFKWRGGEGVPPYRNPQKHKWFKCARIWQGNNDIFNYMCGYRNAALCMVVNGGCINSKMNEIREFSRTLLPEITSMRK